MPLQTLPSQEKLTIGFIGAGVMGEPICRHLIQKNKSRVLVFDSNKDPLERLKQEGAELSNIGTIAQHAHIIFMSLPSENVVREVTQGKNGIIDQLGNAQIVVDLSTSPVAMTREIAAILAAHGVGFADAPVMRTRAAADAGTLAVAIGAPAEVFSAIEPLVRCFASDIQHVGGVGTGQIVKILNNMVLYETVLALSEARAIGVRAGVDPEVLFDVLSNGSADSFALANHGRKAILPQKFPEKAFPVSYARKDISYALTLAQEVDVDACGARNLLETFDRAIAAGYGLKYAPAISLLFEDS